MKLRLVADASVLAGELLRERGRERVANPRLELIVAEHTRGEVEHELRQRVLLAAERVGDDPALANRALGQALNALSANVVVQAEFVYAPLEDEARWRIERDPNDWPTVALALAVDGGIWTEDRDFLGCGLPTWTIRTVERYLERTGQDLE